MPHIICEPCIGTKDASCVDVCPVECIYESSDQFYIHPEECIEESLQQGVSCRYRCYG